MAGWITVFKTIPWGELIATAPMAMRGARKLWETVRRRDAAPPAAGSAEARLQSLEAQVEELRGELTSASGLLATLAEQNAQLVEVVENLRIRTRVLLAISVVLAVAVLGLIAHALMQ